MLVNLSKTSFIFCRKAHLLDIISEDKDDLKNMYRFKTMTLFPLIRVFGRKRMLNVNAWLYATTDSNNDMVQPMSIMNKNHCLQANDCRYQKMAADFIGNSFRLCSIYYSHKTNYSWSDR